MAKGKKKPRGRKQQSKNVASKTQPSKYVLIAARGLNTSDDLLEYTAAIMEAFAAGEIGIEQTKVHLRGAAAVVRLLLVRWKSGGPLALTTAAANVQGWCVPMRRYVTKRSKKFRI